MTVSPRKASSKRLATLPTDLRVELERDPGAPCVARSAVLGRCDDFDVNPSTRHILVLLVLELVSNAVLHSSGPADTPIVLTMSVTDDIVRITVTDSGDGFTLAPRRPEATHGGYGLYLLEKSARLWGVNRVGGTRVWFELARTE